MMSMPVRTEFVTTDPQQMHAMVNLAYADHRLRLDHVEADGFYFEQSRYDLGRVSLDRLAHTMDMQFQVESFDKVFVDRIIASSVELEVNHTERVLGPGDIAFVAPPDVGSRSRFRGCSMQVVGLDVDLFTEVTGPEEPAPLGRLRLDPLPPEQARLWQRTVDYVSDTLHSSDAAAASPLLRGSMERLLAATLLVAYDPVPEERRDTRRDATPTTVRRAVAFIEANPDLDLSVADIARGSHVSVRAVQLAFRRHLDTTPMRYLRRVRLDRAQADLRAATPGDGMTVTSIAARWGYTASRFAADYRAAYGHPPHEMLKGGLRDRRGGESV